MTTTSSAPSSTCTEPDSEITVAWAEVARDIGIELRDDAPDRDQSGELSIEAFATLRASGITSALVPREFGGGGATHAEMGNILRVLGRHDAATAVSLSMHSHLLAAQVWRHRHGMDASAVFRKVVDDHA